MITKQNMPPSPLGNLYSLRLIDRRFKVKAMNMFLIYVLNWLSQTFKSEDEAELEPEEIFSEEAKIIKNAFI